MDSLPNSAEEQVTVATVDVNAAESLLRSGHRYLDVRTVEEFKKGHLDNSINVPFMFFTPQGKQKNPKFVELVSLACNKEDPILVGCQSGVRSLQAIVDLLNVGFKDVKNVGGGYAAWVENSFPVQKPEEELKNSAEPKTEETTTVDVHTAKGLIHSDHRYLDVRTVDEFAKGHLENSLNVPYMFFTPQGKFYILEFEFPAGRVKNQEFVQQVSLVCNKEDQVVVGCQSGVRSLQATSDLLKAGFKDVKNMGGGYIAWVDNGFDVKEHNEEL